MAPVCLRLYWALQLEPVQEEIRNWTIRQLKPKLQNLRLDPVVELEIRSLHGGCKYPLL